MKFAAVTDLTLVELFAGIGGFSCGFERAGVRTVAAVEIDPAARKVFSTHFPNSALFDDVREVSGDDLRATGFVSERGIITAGWPCQDISVAGRGPGLSGGRSGLFSEIVRLLQELQPLWFVLENVPRILSVNTGRDMGAVVGSLAECGYGLAWRIFDARHFGIPQRRRRIFIVGRLGDTGAEISAQVLFESESLCIHSPQTPAEKKECSRSVAPLFGDGGERTDPVAALTAQGVGTCGADDNQAQAGHLIAETYWR